MSIRPARCCPITVLMGILLAGCGGPDAPTRLRETLDRDPQRIRPSSAAHVLPAFVADSQRGWAWTGPGAVSFAWQLPSGAGALDAMVVGPQGMRVRLTAGGRSLTSEPLGAGWNHVHFPVERRFFSRWTQLTLEGCPAPDSCGWGDAVFRGAAGPVDSERLNVIVILVDTLRWDALGAYGSPNRTPVIDGLARDGVLFERAFAQSSWTLPSTASLLTGQLPGDVPGWFTRGHGISESATTLAEIFRIRGWSTAAMVANILVKDESGFGQGFDTYWQSPIAGGDTTVAEYVVRRARTWLAVNAGNPFFLYLHFLDPHDPYGPPGRADGAPIGNPHPAYVGDAPLPDPPTLELWKSLYGQETEYVDRQIGVLLDSLPRAVRERTIVVVTSDHGEEFMEHGYLKHAVTLFDEMVHVPLVIAHPRARRGTRVPQVVRLIDVVPTLAELAGVKVARRIQKDWAGTSLARTVTSGEPPPVLVATGETFESGPMRWYTHDGRRKVVLFNKGYSLPTQFPPLPFPHEWVETQTPAEAAYAAAGPTETPLSPKDAEEAVAAAHRQVAHYVRGKVGGVWLAVVGSGTGKRHDATLELPPAVRPWSIPFFWRPGDHLRFSGRRLILRVRDDTIPRLAALPEATMDDLGSLRLTHSSVHAPLRKAEPVEGTPGIFAWHEPGPMQGNLPAAVADDLMVRLRSLGYIE